MAGSTTFECELDNKQSTDSVAVLRVNLSSGGDAHEWLASYSISTNTSWIVYWGVPNAKRMVFHQRWLCHRSSLNTTSGRHSTGCQAFVDIKVKKVNRDTKRNDPYLKRATPLAAVVKLSQNHNHALDDAEAKRLLRSTSDTRALFFDYFRDGLTPAKAKTLHTKRLSSEEDASEQLASGAFNPDLKVVYRWYNVWRYQCSCELDPTVKLDKKASSYLERGVDIKTTKSVDGTGWAVVVVTKIMRRTQQLNASKEIVFLDSMPLVIATSTLTLFLAATGAGAIPLAVVLHGPRSKESYVAAFSLLKQSYPLCFGGADAPQAFMCGNLLAEKDALRIVWPEVAQLLYPLDVVQAEWRWLQAAENKVDQDERHDLMSAFQKIMYAESLDALDAATEELQAKTHQGYVEHVNASLENKMEWVLLFRRELVKGDDDTKDFAEASVRILRDIVLHSRKAFNLVALVDFVASSWEDYFRRRLLAHAHNRRPMHQLHHDKVLQRLPDSAAKEIEVLDDNVYRVPSGLRGDKTCEVHLDFGMCTCRTGKLGAFCRHQALVHLAHKGAFPEAPVLSADDRKQLKFLALGNKSQVEASFLEFEEASSERPTSSASDEEETSAPLSEQPTYSSVEEEGTSAQPEPPLLADQAPDSEQQLDCSTSIDWQQRCQRADEVMREIQTELKKCYAVAAEGPTHLTTLEKILEATKRIQREAEAISVPSTQAVRACGSGQDVTKDLKRALVGCPSEEPGVKVPKQEP